MASGRHLAGARRRKGDSSPVVNLEIVDVEKVKGLSKFYLYIIHVTCKNGDSYKIRRRYKQFVDVQNSLEKRFPIEAGSIKSTDRTLPNLPGKIIFGRSAVRDVADRRVPLLNDYLRTLFTLPDKIRFDSIVLTFTRPSGDDQDIVSPSTNGYSNSFKPDRPQGKPSRPLKPPPPANKPFPKSPHPITSGLSRSPVPTKALPPRPTPPGSKVKQGPRGKALYNYQANYVDELSFSEAAIISLVRQVDSNWWEGFVDGKKGLVPSNYIQIIEPPVTRLKDLIQSSDEWDSSDEGEKVKLTYYFNGAARYVEVDKDTIDSPSFLSFLRVIQKHLHQSNIVLNYKDKDGDLIEIVDNDDIKVLKTDGISPSGSNHTPWIIYVTMRGDHTPYHINPYS